MIKYLKFVILLLSLAINSPIMFSDSSTFIVKVARPLIVFEISNS